MANSSINRLTLFSSNNWWLGGETAPQLSGDTSFYTAQNTRVPLYSYGVNTTGQFNPNGYIGLDSKHHLTQSDTTDTYTGNLSIANNKTGRLTSNAVVGATPDIPSQYSDRVSYYGVSDSQFDTLMAQPEFIIPRVGSGLKVTTDGMGHVASVSVDPSAVGLLSSYGTVPLPNRAALTAGAIYKVDPSDSPYATNTLKNGPIKRNNPSQALNNNVLKRQAPVQSLLSKQSGLNPLKGISTEERLNTLFANAQVNFGATTNQGLNISGQDSQLNPQQARQVATVQANFEVPSTPGFQKTLAELASANQAGQTPYASLPTLPSIDRVMDGKVAMMPPGMPGNNPFANQRATSDSRMDSIEGFLNASERQSSGGYLPSRFMGESATSSQQQPQTSSGGGGMGFSQQGDAGTSGQSFSEEQRRRQQRQSQWAMTA
jgi:hypothetical protein